MIYQLGTKYDWSSMKYDLPKILSMMYDFAQKISMKYDLSIKY